MGSDLSAAAGRISEILEKETELLRKILPVQSRVRTALEKRRWDEFENNMSDINILSEEFETLEAERECIFAETFRGNGRRGERGWFYSRVSIFPRETRNKLADSYRSLKMEALRVKLFNDSFAGYLSAARSLTGEFLETIMPDRRVRLYSREGKTASLGLKSMMLNQSM